MKEQNNLFFTGQLSFENTGTSSQISQQTKNRFDGLIYPIKLPSGETGPFYQVSEKKFSCVARFQACAKHSRVKKLECKLLSKSINQRDFKLFLMANFEEIEMDTEFKLLEKTKTFFKCEEYNEVEKIFKEISRSRWLGLTESQNFDEANRYYNLEHYKNHWENKKPLYLYEIYFNVPVGIPNLEPVLFSGKVAGGSSLQFKINNHAVMCVSKIEQVCEWKKTTADSTD